MKKLFLLLFPLLSPILFAQSGQISNTVLQNASGYAKIPTPSSVYVCAYNVQNDCTVPDNEIIIYSDQALTQPIAQPLLSDNNGRYSYFLPSGTLALEKDCFTAQQCQTYTVSISSGGGATPPAAQLLGGTGTAFSPVTLGSGLQLISGVLTSIAGNPAGPTQSCQFNNSSMFGGSAGCLFTPSTGTLSLGASGGIKGNFSLGDGTTAFSSNFGASANLIENYNFDTSSPQNFLYIGSVTQYPGIKCDGVNDDTAGFTALASQLFITASGFYWSMSLPTPTDSNHNGCRIHEWNMPGALKLFSNSPRQGVITYNGAGGYGTYVMRESNASFTQIDGITVYGVDGSSTSNGMAENLIQIPGDPDIQSTITNSALRESLGDAIKMTGAGGLSSTGVTNLHFDHIRFDAIGGCAISLIGNSSLENRPVSFNEWTLDNNISGNYATIAAATTNPASGQPYLDSTSISGHWGYEPFCVTDGNGIFITSTEARIETNRPRILRGSGASNASAITGLLFQSQLWGTAGNAASIVVDQTTHSSVAASISGNVITIFGLDSTGTGVNLLNMRIAFNALNLTIPSVTGPVTALLLGVNSGTELIAGAASASRTSNVITFTGSPSFGYSIGQTIKSLGFTDTSFNTTCTAIAPTSGATVTCLESGSNPNGTSTGGTITNTANTSFIEGAALTWPGLWVYETGTPSGNFMGFSSVGTRGFAYSLQRFLPVVSSENGRVLASATGQTGAVFSSGVVYNRNTGLTSGGKGDDAITTFSSLDPNTQSPSGIAFNSHSEEAYPQSALTQSTKVFTCNDINWHPAVDSNPGGAGPYSYVAAPCGYSSYSPDVLIVANCSVGNQTITASVAGAVQAANLIGNANVSLTGCGVSSANLLTTIVPNSIDPIGNTFQVAVAPSTAQTATNVVWQQPNFIDPEHAEASIPTSSRFACGGQRIYNSSYAIGLDAYWVDTSDAVGVCTTGTHTWTGAGKEVSFFTNNVLNNSQTTINAKGTSGQINITNTTNDWTFTLSTTVLRGAAAPTSADQVPATSGSGAGTIVWPTAIPDCPDTGGNHINWRNTANGGPLWSCGSSTGSSVTFGTLPGGTNTTAAMVVGTGASLGASGTGTIVATSVVGGVSAAVLRGYCVGTATSSTTLAMFNFGEISSANCTATATNNGAFLANRNGVFKNLYVSAGTGGTSSSSGVFTLFDNGVAQVVTCTVGTGTTCNDTTHTYTATAGHLYSLRFTTQATETLASLVVSMDFQ